MVKAAIFDQFLFALLQQIFIAMKRILLSVLFISAAIVFMSNGIGRGTATGNGAAGAPGDGQTCSSSNCHKSGPFGTDVKLTLTKDGAEVTEYTPGESYFVSVDVETSMGSPARYGFQMTALSSSDDSGAGTFSELSTNSKALTFGDRTYLEHTSPSSSSMFTSTWTAPEAGTGNINFYVAGNAVNGNGGPSGDDANNKIITISESGTSGLSILNSDDIKIYPNPIGNVIKIDSDIKQAMSYDIMSISGVIMSRGSLSNASIDVSDLQSGLYIIRIMGSDFEYTQKILKR